MNDNKISEKFSYPLLTHQLPDSFLTAIRIPTPFPVGDVFAYLILDEKVVLIDCGQFQEEAFLRIKNSFREKGLELQDLDEIWITHAHPDHFGQAARLQSKCDAKVFASVLEKSNLENYSDRVWFADLFNELGLPDPVITKMDEQLTWLQQFQQPLEPDGWLQDGDQLTSGKKQFQVKHLPGHAAGHIAFVQKDGIVFGGDVLLSHISTNALIHFNPETGERNRSFLQYRDSLKWFEKHGGRIYPGHGDVIPDATSLAATYLKNQEKRLNYLLRYLAKRPSNLTELSRQFFPDAWKHESYFLVISEILGYLDWGRSLGFIREELREEVPYFYSE